MWHIDFVYGAWRAEHTLGFTVWGRTKEEVISALGVEP